MHFDESLKDFILTADVYKNQPIEVVNLHSNYIIWIKEKGCTCSVNFKEETFKGNTLLFLNRGEIFECDIDDYQEIVVIHFNPLFFNSATFICKFCFNSLVYVDAAAVSFTEADGKKVERALDTIIQIHDDPSHATLMQLDESLSQILIQGLAVKLRKQYPYVIGFIENVEEVYKEEHVISEYASKLSVDPKTLLQKFRKLEMKNPGGVVKARVLIEAKRLLAYTDMTTRKICYEIGFDDPAYFSRFFKKNTSMTPLEFRGKFAKKNIET